MEKWAKSMNAQKQSQQDVFKRPVGMPGSLKTESAAADAGFSMFTKPVSLEKITLRTCRIFTMTPICPVAT